MFVEIEPLIKKAKSIAGKTPFAASLIIAEMENAPRIDAEGVKRGEWIEQEEMYYGDIYYTCSVCKNDWATIDGTPLENKMNYCPHCGAKMDMEE